MVVLANGRTSGATEAVAAAIQDQRRGVVLGSTTAGEVTVTVGRRYLGTVFQVPAAHLLRASGQPLDGKGVVPDMAEVPAAPVSAAPSDVACPGVVSPGRVSEDPLVRRAAGLLLAPPAG